MKYSICQNVTYFGHLYTFCWIVLATSWPIDHRCWSGEEKRREGSEGILRKRAREGGSVFTLTSNKFLVAIRAAQTFLILSLSLHLCC